MMTAAWYEEGLDFIKAGDDRERGRFTLTAAAQYMMKLGVPEKEIGADAVLDLTIRSLALHWFDHPDAVGNEAAFPNTIRPLITMYKLAYGQ